MALLGRRARHEDFEAVMAINQNVYDGIDYMPSRFHFFLHSNKYMVLVMEQHGNIIALGTYYISPLEHLVTTMSLRSSPSAPRRLMRIKGEHVWKSILLKDFPKVTHYMSLSKRWPSLTEDVHEILYQWNVLVYSLSTTDLEIRLRERREPTGSASLHELSYSDTLDLLHGTNKFEEFLHKFSSEYVAFSHSVWMPVRIDNKTELKGTFSISKTIISIEGSPGRSLNEGFKVLNSSGYHITALSCSCLWPAKCGLTCEVFFYGHDINDAVSHFITHISRVTHMYTGSVTFMFQFPESIKSDHLDRALLPMLGNKVTNNTFDGTPLVLYRSLLIVKAKI